MVNQAPCVNTGTNLAPTKPATTQIPTCIFGTPKGETGRRSFAIQGIVLHCIDEPLAQYDAKMKAGISPSDDTPHGSLHYMISSAGVVHQYVDDANLSWGFDAYNDPLYPTNAEVSGITWPVLQGVNGAATSPDHYVINIGLESGLPVMKNGCVNCPGPTVLADAGCDALVQLLAYLAATYSIPISSDYIQFHQFVDCNAANECPCADFTTLLQNVVAYCEPCVSPVATTLPEYNPATDNIQGLIAKTTQNCCDDAGCQICLPMDALTCVVGNLIPDGDINFFVGVMQQTDQTYCLVRNVINVAAPITGNGTVNSPLTIDRCAIDAFLPSGTILKINGTDSSGCWVDEDAQTIIQRLETPITPVDTSCINLTVSGQSNHTLQADIIVSPVAGNFLSCESDGLLVSFDNCDVGELIPLSGDPELTSIVGLDSSGCLVHMDDNTVISYNICQLLDAQGLPLRILGDNATECPVFFTPGQVISQGLGVVDTDSIDLTITPGNPTQISADIILAGAQNGVDNCTRVIAGEGVYTPCVTFNALDSECITLTIVDNAIEASLDIAPPQAGTGNALECLANGDGAYVPTGANVVVNGPIVGTGTENDPLDIDYTLLDAQDLCDFGGVLPVGVLNMFVGIDSSDCLRVQDPNAAVFSTIQVQDGNCIDLSLTSGDPNTLSAELILAGAQGGIGNALQCIAGQGAYVPVGSGLVFNDTSCITLDLVAGVVTANPVIAGSQNGIPNQLSCINGQGLYVPQGAGLTALDTECIDITITNGVISAIPTISPTQNGVANALSCTGQGLYVPQGASLAVNDGECVNLTFNDGTLSAELIVAPAQGGVNNQLTCIAGQGAYVPLGAGLVFNDTQCIELTQTGDVITATPVISPSQGGIANRLTCTAQGLYVPDTATITVQDTQCIDLTLTGNVLSADPIIDPNLNNALTCGANGLLVNPTFNFVDNCLNSNSTISITAAGGGVYNVDMQAGDVVNAVRLPPTAIDTPCSGPARPPINPFSVKTPGADGCSATLDFLNIYAEEPLQVQQVGNDIVVSLRPTSFIEANQTVDVPFPNNVFTQVPWNNVTRDVLGEFAGGVFTASCAGCYQVSVVVTLAQLNLTAPPLTSQPEFTIETFVNGVFHSRVGGDEIPINSTVPVIPTANGSIGVCLDVGDTLDIRVFHDTGNTESLQSPANGVTRLTISRILGT